MDYQTILFDLDGTLTDSGPGITNSAAWALEKHGIQVPDRSELYRFIGPPLPDSFRDFYGMSKEQATQAVKDYREYYAEKGIFENEVYPGIPPLLDALRRENKTLIVATSKPEKYARRILTHFRLDDYFLYVAGAAIDETRSKKSEVIEYALAECGITDRSKTIMIGDRKHDILGARQCGLASVGVLYGYGSREELEEAGASWLAETPEDVARLLCNGPDLHR